MTELTSDLLSKVELLHNKKRRKKVVTPPPSSSEDSSSNDEGEGDAEEAEESDDGAEEAEESDGGDGEDQAMTSQELVLAENHENCTFCELLIVTKKISCPKCKSIGCEPCFYNQVNRKGVPEVFPLIRASRRSALFKKLFPECKLTYKELLEQNPKDPRILATEEEFVKASKLTSKEMKAYEKNHPVEFLAEKNRRKQIRKNRKPREKKILALEDYKPPIAAKAVPAYAPVQKEEDPVQPMEEDELKSPDMPAYAPTLPKPVEKEEDPVQPMEETKENQDQPMEAPANFSPPPQSKKREVTIHVEQAEEEPLQIVKKERRRIYRKKIITSIMNVAEEIKDLPVELRFKLLEILKSNDTAQMQSKVEEVVGKEDEEE